MFCWDCPVLQAFWQDIIEEIEKMMNIAILMEPMLFVLGVPPENVTGKDQRYKLRQLILIDEKA